LITTNWKLPKQAEKSCQTQVIKPLFFNELIKKRMVSLGQQLLLERGKSKSFCQLVCKPKAPTAPLESKLALYCISTIGTAVACAMVFFPKKLIQ
jgi:hypothetical protein